MNQSSSRFFVLVCCMLLAASLFATFARAAGAVSRLSCDMSMEKAFVDARDKNLNQVKVDNRTIGFYHDVSSILAGKISSIFDHFTASNHLPLNDTQIQSLNIAVFDGLKDHVIGNNLLIYCPAGSQVANNECSARADGTHDEVLDRVPYFSNDSNGQLILHLPGMILDYKKIAVSDLNADGIFRAVFGKSQESPESSKKLQEAALENIQSACLAYKTDIAGIASSALEGSKNVPASSVDAGSGHLTGSGSLR